MNLIEMWKMFGYNVAQGSCDASSLKEAEKNMQHQTDILLKMQRLQEEINPKIYHHQPTKQNNRDYWYHKPLGSKNKIARTKKDDFINALYEFYFGRSDYNFETIFKTAVAELDRTTETKRSYIADYNRLLQSEESLKNKDVRLITYKYVKDYILNYLDFYEHLKGAKATDKEMKKAKHVFQLVMDYCIDNEIAIKLTSLPKNALFDRHFRTRKPNRNNVENKAYSPADIEMLENTLNARIERNKGYIQCINALALLCSINTGMRIAELSGLKWEHVTEKTIHVCGQIVRDGKTYKYINTTKDEKYREDENGGRYIPTTKKLRAIFQMAKEKQKQYGIETDFVFGRNETFSNPNQIESALYHTAQELGLKCTNNHAIRIYFNSYVLAKNGVRVSERAKFLGHSAKINEEVYTLPLNDDEFLVEMENILERENVTQNNPKCNPKIISFPNKKKTLDCL